MRKKTVREILCRLGNPGSEPEQIFTPVTVFTRMPNRIITRSGYANRYTSDIDIAEVDGLKVLDPKRPIREADIRCAAISVATGQSATLSPEKT